MCCSFPVLYSVTSRLAFSRPLEPANKVLEAVPSSAYSALVANSRSSHLGDSPWIRDAHRVPHPAIVRRQVILRRRQVSRTRQRGGHGWLETLQGSSSSELGLLCEWLCCLRAELLKHAVPQMQLSKRFRPPAGCRKAFGPGRFEPKSCAECRDDDKRSQLKFGNAGSPISALTLVMSFGLLLVARTATNPH